MRCVWALMRALSRSCSAAARMLLLTAASSAWMASRSGEHSWAWTNPPSSCRGSALNAKALVRWTRAVRAMTCVSARASKPHAMAAS